MPPVRAAAETTSFVAVPPENTASMRPLETTSPFGLAARNRYTASSRRSVEHGGQPAAIVGRGRSMDVPDHQSAIGVYPIGQIVVAEWTHSSLHR
jgi:hypothetical protein